MRVMVTGAGAPGIAGTLYALRNNPDGSHVWTLGVDAREDVVGRFLADGFATVPYAGDERFIPEIVSIAREYRIDVLLPQVTAELGKVSAAIGMLKAEGISTAVSPPDAIPVANDKYNLLEIAREIGVPCPRYRLAANEEEMRDAALFFGYPDMPFVVKPRDSNGQRGFRIVTEEGWTPERFLREKPSGIEISLDGLVSVLSRGVWPELLVTEYLPGIEYTIDAFVGEHVRMAVPRARTEIRSGISFRTKTEMRNDLVDWSLLLAERLGLRFAVGFQFKLSAQGIPCLLECNPRVQGTMVAGVFAGFNFMYYACRESMGMPVRLDEIQPLRQIDMFRYWGGLVPDADGPAALRL